MNLVNLIGKRILITGASSGIGRACAVEAASLGASVVLTGRRADALDETWRRMDGSDRHTIVSGDISDPAFIASLPTATGKLDGLVHAAGIGPMCPIGFVDTAFVESVFKTNYLAFLELVKVYSKLKNRASKMSMVAISSIAASAGWAGVSVYAGSKGALSASVRALAMELAPKGVRVNSVSPSNIKTPMYEAGAGALNDEPSMQEFLKKQPLGLGLPEQVAAPICFLLSDAASFITGVDLPVDGGYLAQ